VHPARRLWLAVEPVHAVTYFDPGCREAASGTGMKGFWMGYFGFRAAPLGPIGPAPVEAIFAGFRPQWVARALPDAWSYASPETCLEARLSSATAALRGAGVVDADADAAAVMLEPLCASLVVTGRPLAAANAVLALSDDPVARLWQLTTTLREHRGDGHVAAIVAEGLSGLDAHLLQVAAGESKWGSRGWTDEERAEAEARLRDEGLLDAVGALTAAGVARRAAVEERTDAAAWAGGVGAALGADGVDAVVVALRPATTAASSLLYFPNPIGLPAGG
jgi:hypothetical protein